MSKWRFTFLAGALTFGWFLSVILERFCVHNYENGWRIKKKNLWKWFSKGVNGCQLLGRKWNIQKIIVLICICCFWMLDICNSCSHGDKVYNLCVVRERNLILYCTSTFGSYIFFRFWYFYKLGCSPKPLLFFDPLKLSGFQSLRGYNFL